MDEQTTEDLSATVPEGWAQPAKGPRRRPVAQSDVPRFLLPALFVFAVIFIYLARPFVSGDRDFSVSGVLMVSLFGALILTPLYVIPTIVADQRKHYNYTAIMLLNVFLGWTLIGWVGALIWAVVRTREEKGR